MPIIGTRGSLSSGGFGEFRRAAAAGQTYWISVVFNGNRYVLRGNNLPTLISGIPASTGQTPTTPANPAFFSSQRVGVVLASGTSAWADALNFSSNNGTSWTNLATTYGNAAIYGNSTYPSIGLNGSFTYRPTSNTIAVFDSYYNGKANTVEPRLWLFNASTGALVNSYVGQGLSGSQPPRSQILYSPALDRYFIFLANTNSTCRGSSFTSTGILTGLVVPADLLMFAAGVSSSGNVLLFVGSSSTRELREYTAADLSAYTSYGTVSGLAALTGSTKYSRMIYLPVNGKYGMVEEGTNPSSVSFNSSSVSTPASFTRTSITPSILGSYTFASVRGSSIFEDTDGTIYVTMLAYLTGKSTELWSLAYKSTDGGASFSGAAGSPYNGMYSPMVIAKNLQ